MTVSGDVEEHALSEVTSGFAMCEGPRWFDGAIVLTDIHDDAIKRIDENGTVTTLVSFPSPPISTGFTSDGTMLVSALRAARLWRIGNGAERAVTTFADLGDLSPYDWGDIVIDAHDRVYIANQGMSYPDNMPERIDSRIYLVVEGQAPRLLASEFLYANGLAISPDGSDLIVAESFGHRLWRLPIRSDGSLGERSLIVQLPDTDRPDGICCDTDGGVWSANATARAVIRVDRVGRITDRIDTGDDLAIGCILGGADGRDLYVTTAPTADRQTARALRSATLWRTRVRIPAGGRP